MENWVGNVFGSDFILLTYNVSIFPDPHFSSHSDFMHLLQAHLQPFVICAT